MAKQDLTPLVIKAQAGDQTALNDLISACYQDLYYYAYKTAGSEDLAADVTQESCLEIITTLDKLREPGAFSVWARRIVYHRCAKYFRDNREVTLEENEDGETLLDRLPDENPDSLPEQIQEDKEFRQLMQQMLNELPAQQRSALLLYYYEHLSVGQIAQIQNTTEGTVKSRLNYSRKAIKAQVETYEKKTGVRLHSLAPLPLLLLFLFQQEMAQVSAGAPVPVIPAVPAAAGAGASAGTAAGIGTKIVAGIVAAAVVVGGIVGGVTLLGKDGASGFGGSSGGKNKEPGHTHQYTTWEYDEDTHWGVCECEEVSKAEAHTFDGRDCTVCAKKKPSEGLEFKQSGDYYHVIGIGTCTDTDIVIPATHEGLPVSRIEDYAFQFNKEITSVEIPDSVTYIGGWAFWECSALREVRMPKMAKISFFAFRDCTALTQLQMPVYSSMYQRSFILYQCTQLQEVWMADGTQSIGEGDFSGCTSLQTIHVPATVERIGTKAFMDCTSLAHIYYCGTMEQWKAVRKESTQAWDEFTNWRTNAGNFTVHCTDGDLTGADAG